MEDDDFIPTIDFRYLKKRGDKNLQFRAHDGSKWLKWKTIPTIEWDPEMEPEDEEEMGMKHTNQELAEKLKYGEKER